MPFADINDTRIYYEIHGPTEGTNLVLLEGWGESLWRWFRQLPEFSKHHRVIIFDNRGAGRSAKPDIPYTIKLFAEDTYQLLKFLAIEKAHILGISMGGYIAQQFAFSYPKIVQGLILASTCFGGPKSRAIQPSNEIMAAMFAMPTETISLEEATAIRRSTAWSEKFLKENNELVKQMDKWISENPQPEYARGRQAEASLSFDSEEFVGKITAPTLILHGEKDQIVVPENAKMLLNAIPNSRLILFRDSPHRILVERYNDVNKLVLNFLTEVETGNYLTEPRKNIV